MPGARSRNLPRRYAARPPEFEFRLRLRFKPRTANVIMGQQYYRLEPLARDPVPPVIAPATPADLPAILQLLEVSKLPRAELERHIGTTLVAKEGKQLVGTAALELYGTAALLRSVAVAAERRGHGLGQTLTAAALDLAHRRGVHTVYLLTETAAHFFPKFGFRPIPRSDVDQAVLRSYHPFTTLAEEVNNSLAQERVVAELSSLFGLLALILTSVGLYGVMTYTVARRTSEIGIRMALGARGPQVLWLVLRESLEFVTLGVIIGIPLVFAFARLISSQLYGITKGDPLTLCAAIALEASIAAIAAYIPARRATKVDPMVALHYE